MTAINRDVLAGRAERTNIASGRRAPQASKKFAACDDRELMLVIATGDERALGELYDRFGPIAYKLASRMLRESRLAEDAVQEAFLSIWRLAGQFDPCRGSARNWILTLVHRRAVNLVRHHEEARRAPIQQPTEPQTVSLSPDETAELAAQRLAVQVALAELPTGQRTVLELAYYAGYTEQQIADSLATPIGTVKSQTFEGLTRLRQLLTAVDGLKVTARVTATETTRASFARDVRNGPAAPASSRPTQ